MEMDLAIDWSREALRMALLLGGRSCWRWRWWWAWSWAWARP